MYIKFINKYIRQYIMKRERLEEFNGWWFTGKVPDELSQEYRRALFYELAANLPKRPILSIVGLRRTGKTTLMFQLMQNLLEQKTPKDNILYFNFDEYAEGIDELLDSYRETQNKDFRADRTYVFLDEIQKVNDWANQIKKYHDLYPKIKFVVSGSESLFIAAKAKETLAGRLREFVLKPLSFKEFLEIKGLQPHLPVARLKALFIEYVENGGFPEMAGKQKTEVKEYVKSVVLDKIVFKDIVKLFGVKDTDTLRQLIEIIATNPGMYIEYQSLAQQLGKDRRSIKNYVMLLKESFIIRILGNYRKGAVPSLRKTKRVYPVDSSIIFAFKPVIDDQFMGRVVETAVINHLDAYTFWRNSHEVDAVLNGVPIEVKYQNKIIDKDLSGLREFMRKFSARRGVMVTKSEEGKVKTGEGEIVMTPAWKFLLNPP